MRHIIDWFKENWQAGLFFGLMTVVGIVFLAAKLFGFTAAHEIGKRTTDIGNLGYEKYDGVPLEGSEVINAIKQYQNEIPIKVYNGESEVTYNGNFTVSGNDRKSEKYINPHHSYNGSLVKDANQVVVGLVFAKEGVIPSEKSLKELLALAVGGDAENSSMQDLINKVSGTIATKDASIAALTQNVASLNTSVSNLQTQNSGLTSQLNTANTKYNTLNSEVTSGKSLIASAITNKGVSTSASASYTTMASNINNISGVKFKSGSIQAATGTTSIELGFQPSTVIILLSGVVITSPKNKIYDGYNRCYWTSIIAEGGQGSYNDMILKSSTGFSVNWSTSGWGLDGSCIGTWYAYE